MRDNKNSLRLLPGGKMRQANQIAVQEPKIRLAADFRSVGLLDPYLQGNPFRDDIRPYLLALAEQHPELEAFHFIEFIQKCVLTGADPRRNQAYLIPYKKKVLSYYNGQSNEKWVTVANTIFAYQFFIAKAQELGDFEGFSTETIRAIYFNPFSGNELQTICSVTTVKRRDRDPFSYRAWLPEFVKLKNGQPTEAWASKPYLMLEKCSIANAFRQAWPEAMNGMYINEEMSGEPSKEVFNPRAVVVAPKPIAEVALDKAIAAIEAKDHLEVIGKERSEEEARRAYAKADPMSFDNFRG